MASCDLICCSCHDVCASFYSCFAFPCPCSTNCCGLGVPPCGYNPLVHMLRFSHYKDFYRHPKLKWIPLWSDGCPTTTSLTSIPITEWLHADAQLTLIISHGNGQDLQYLTTDVVPRLRAGLRTPVNIVCYEYPGYSLSPLPTSEALCLRAAEATYRYVRKQLRVPARQVVAYGISLGTGPAVHLAAHHKVGVA
jgi:hypothetical protein